MGILGDVRVKLGLRSALTLLGKGEKKVAAVFGISAKPCHEAVVHVKAGAPEVPVWLFATAAPLPETAALCERVYVCRNSLWLFLQAQIRLWPCWVAIGVSTWTAEHGRWLVKLAPFFIPPFRTLLLNSWGGFFPGRPALILLHWHRFLHGATMFGWIRVKEISQGCWMMVSYHMWRSSPVKRTQEIAMGCWMMVSYHVWRSGPVRRAGDYWRVVSYHVWRSGPVRRAVDFASGAFLFTLATVLGWLGGPHRGWFRRMHGGDALAGGEIVPGAGVDRFVQKGVAWDGRGLAELVQSSGAGLILWQQEDHVGDDDVEDMLRLFDDPRTFAVARQAVARAWKPAMLPMAPFRHLQAGTASQVLAPMAGTILVDRRKLASLGVPQTGLTGTAWMLAFWKAAAAGWRCYSAPEREQGGLQPDYPVQETAFFLRILADRELRRLGPRELELSRGNVAFAPELQSPLRPGRLKVVLLSPFLPYPLSHGGAVRIFNLCRELADRVDFILIAIREAHDVTPYEKLHQIFRQVYTVDIDEHESNDMQLPRQVRATTSASLRALIADVCERVRPDLLQIEFTHMAAYRDCAPAVPAVLVEHDLTFSLYCQLAKADSSEAAWSEYRRWLAFERHWLAEYDAVWTVSEEDRYRAIGEGSHRGRTYAVPNGVDVRRYLPSETAVESAEILYVGSFRHLPNAIGFQKLREEVMPRVWERVPNARLRVVAGPQHEYFWSTFAKNGERMDCDPRIAIHGYVEDLRPLYAGASVVVAPLEVSAGTNIKVLEAMACGKAVVATAVACAGLGLEDGEDAFIRQDWESFAEAVCEALLNGGLRSKVGARARQTTEARFSWTSIAGVAYASYLAMAAPVEESLAQRAG